MRLVWVADVCSTFADQNRGVPCIWSNWSKSFLCLQFLSWHWSICFQSSSLMIFGCMLLGMYLYTLLFKFGASVCFGWGFPGHLPYCISPIVILDTYGVTHCWGSFIIIYFFWAVNDIFIVRSQGGLKHIRVIIVYCHEESFSPSIEWKHALSGSKIKHSAYSPIQSWCCMASQILAALFFRSCFSQNFNRDTNPQKSTVLLGQLRIVRWSTWSYSLLVDKV